MSAEFQHAIRNKRTGLLPTTVLLYHDNSRNNKNNSKPQVYGSATRTLQSRLLTVTTFMPSVHLKRHFGVAGVAVRVIEAVQKWIRKQPKTCFSDGIRKLADGYKPYVDTWGTLCWMVKSCWLQFTLFVVRKSLLRFLFDVPMCIGERIFSLFTQLCEKRLSFVIYVCLSVRPSE